MADRTTDQQAGDRRIEQDPYPQDQEIGAKATHMVDAVTEETEDGPFGSLHGDADIEGSTLHGGGDMPGAIPSDHGPGSKA